MCGIFEKTWNFVLKLEFFWKKPSFFGKNRVFCLHTVCIKDGKPMTEIKQCGIM